MNIQHFLENGNQKFPLSTAALDFIQEQIKLVYKLTDLAGANVIIKNSTSSVPGLVIFNGELLPLQGTPTTYIRIIENTEHLSVEGFDGNVRTTRIAVYSPSVMGGTCKPANLFTVLKNISTLMAEFEEAKKHHVPRGAIMMWSGTIANIPQGWALCNGANGTPNLQGRFVIGQGSVTESDGITYTYGIGDKGGKSKHKLSIDEMPTHNHNTGSSTSNATVYTKDNEGTHTHEIPSINGDGWGSKVRGGSESDASAWPKTNSTGSAHKHSFEMYARGGGSAHENRPLYYALAYIIKVI